MDEYQLFKHKIINTIQSWLLVIAMMITLSLLGWLLGGVMFALYAILLVIIIFLFNHKISPYLILKMYRTKKITHHQAPNLYKILTILSKRADLQKIPQLYYLPSDLMNAFTVGTEKDAVIALSDGILQRLSQKEIAAILAHEISHIVNGDVKIMRFADFTNHLTNILSIVGQILLLLNLPLYFLEVDTISWLLIFVLIFAPIVTNLLQLALSRTREYDADLGAAQILGDPTMLAAALTKMGNYQKKFLAKATMPGHYAPEPSLLRTHPSIKNRVKRLLELKKYYNAEDSIWQELVPDKLPLTSLVLIEPRWHMSGVRF
ncbi:zinc metalloprotease HtpX [Candidatus Halobeggiatoa sp. HSG11]|nr:zinc metalloprotease HtpX [Candidatus Halobeggiatoa sp. HSG11]